MTPDFGIASSTVPMWLSARNLHLVETFGVFLLVQLLFAALYFWLYRRHRENFSFNSDILKNQTNTTRLVTEDKLIRYRAVLDAFHLLQEELKSGAAPISKERESSLTLSSGYRFIMTFFQGDRAYRAHSKLRVLDTENNVVLDEAVMTRDPQTGLYKDDWFQTAQQWQTVVTSQIEHYESLECTERSRLDSFLTPTPDVWSYWDFLYFSTIVQTTVGFGDILPNSTAVRILVALHIVIGYVLLVVVLNIVLGSPT